MESLRDQRQIANYSIPHGPIVMFKTPEVIPL
jgi:hypothetical protein